ncbi:hypothetical protein AG1IA_10239 [Rhizoctonia solani AG-1 IA]|uniref:Uncharacterized protein n=1 Tax=Thanatephorus cucumeris (strain AG1-IA) TaxID=983506 RepID=L8WC31_THACA|nr:hypothetical protein AG1IA_10239 [Rhizoctonia solani AG-1 IA]
MEPRDRECCHECTSVWEPVGLETCNDCAKSNRCQLYLCLESLGRELNVILSIGIGPQFYRFTLR